MVLRVLACGLLFIGVVVAAISSSHVLGYKIGWDRCVAVSGDILGDVPGVLK